METSQNSPYAISRGVSLMRGKPVVALALLLLGPASASAPRATADKEAGHYRSVAMSAQAPSADERAAMLRGIDAKRDKYAGVAKEIWGFAEVGYQEQKSSALLQ